MSEAEIRDLLADFLEAWARRDVAAALHCFGEGAIYFASIGPMPGRKAQGKAEIGKQLATMFALDDQVFSTTSDLRIDGQHASWKWRYEFADGSTALGCDLFEFSAGKIIQKDAYRKVFQTEPNLD